VLLVPLMGALAWAGALLLRRRLLLTLRPLLRAA
jgi:hypothetical protein